MDESLDQRICIVAVGGALSEIVGVFGGKLSIKEPVKPCGNIGDSSAEEVEGAGDGQIGSGGLSGSGTGDGVEDLSDGESVGGVSLRDGR